MLAFNRNIFTIERKTCIDIKIENVCVCVQYMCIWSWSKSRKWHLEEENWEILFQNFDPMTLHLFDKISSFKMVHTNIHLYMYIWWYSLIEHWNVWILYSNQTSVGDGLIIIITRLVCILVNCRDFHSLLINCRLGYLSILVSI